MSVDCQRPKRPTEAESTLGIYTWFLQNPRNLSQRPPYPQHYSQHPQHPMSHPAQEKEAKHSPETPEHQPPQTAPNPDPPGTVNITGGKCVEVKEVKGDKTVKKFVYKVEIVDTCDGEEDKRIGQHLDLLTSGLGAPVGRKKRRKPKSTSQILWGWTPSVLKYGGVILGGWMALHSVRSYVRGASAQESGSKM